MSQLFPSLSALSGAFPTPSRGSFFPSFNVAGVLDDAKSKAKALESQAKDGIEGAKGSVKAEAEVIKTKAQAAGPQGGKIELYSPKYYAACSLGGVLACGITHAFVTPLDLVKCRRQVDKNLYKGNLDGWAKIYRAGGLSGLYTGVGPTFIGYSIQGACKYGFYELFKKKYSDAVGPTNAVKYKDAIYLAGSASAEFIADAAFVPLEAVKVRMQTTMPSYAAGTADAFRKFTAAEGTAGLYTSLGSLWSRQIPYTMMKFWSFEATVAKIYASLGKPKESYNKLQQLGVSFVGGYIAGVFCAVVSHPADTMVSKLNAQGKEGSVKPTVSSIYKEIGFGGLWAGLGTRIIMVGTLTALQWLIYDYVKVIFGLPTTGAASPQKK
jgi:solute carrier family 25 phosphate transporter 3